MVCTTFARDRSWQEMLEGFGLDPREAVRQSYAEAIETPGRPRVRAGESSGWAFAVEASSSNGTRPETLARLSGEGGEAFVLSYTPTISSFAYAADREFVCGFDLLAPQRGWGTDPHLFDAQIDAAGLLAPEANPYVVGARFVQLAVGVTIEPSLLERRLPGVELPA
jgi:hypothetical protein